VEVPTFTLAASVWPSITVPASGTTDIAATAFNGFTGLIALTASGLPPGVTASFSPASIAPRGTSTLTFATTSATPAGVYTITVAGTSGSTVVTTKLILTLKVPGFLLVDSSSYLTIRKPGLAATAIYVAAANGFTGAVALSVSGLPSGVTATFAPTTASPASPTTLTLTASSSTPAGTYDILVSGSSGTAIASTVVVLKVTAPTGALIFEGYASKAPTGP
jgi:hypothetical protein